jgi:glucose-6-phosphate 1-dehydrogenase
MAEEFGVADRGHFYDPVGALRDVVQNHLMQVLTLLAMEPPTGSSSDSIDDRRRDVLTAMADADPAQYVRGQYDGYRSVGGVAPGSETETFAALRLDIDNWRWSGVPFFIRAGKELPASVTEVRVIFKSTPYVGFTPKGSPRPEANQWIFRVGPTSPGTRLGLVAKQAASWDRRPIELDMTFDKEGGEGPTAYETLLDGALGGHHALFAREDGIEESWRVLQPLLDNRPPVQIYQQHTWGPEGANQLVRDFGGWHEPWLPK